MPLAPQVAGPQTLILNGRVFIETNWRDADSLRDHLCRQCLPGTVKLDPALHEARIELWDHPDVDRVRAAVDDWLSGD